LDRVEWPTLSIDSDPVVHNGSNACGKEIAGENGNLVTLFYQVLREVPDMGGNASCGSAPHIRR
jgi:hypothetical protein